jgi:hypothetical protein
MRNTRGCGAVFSSINRHFSRHWRLGPWDGKELELVYTVQKTPADNGTLRRGITSQSEKGVITGDFTALLAGLHTKVKNQRSSFLLLTRKLRLEWVQDDRVLDLERLEAACPVRSHSE